MTFYLNNPRNSRHYNEQGAYDIGVEQYQKQHRQYQLQIEEQPQLHSSPLRQLRQPMFEHRQPSPFEELNLRLRQLRQPKLQKPLPKKEHIPPAQILRQPRLQHSALQRQLSRHQDSPTSLQRSQSHCTEAEENQLPTDVDVPTDSCDSQCTSGNNNGVKKVPNKEWRRRQNMHLRRILKPKTALIVLNEVLPGQTGADQLKVEPAPSHPHCSVPGEHVFRAELTLRDVTYKGYGYNKLAARNDVAEQVFRDRILKQMGKLQEGCRPGWSSLKAQKDKEEEDSGDEEEYLPMIQLASFALHKLFAEWECDGYKVPQLNMSESPWISEESETEEITPTLTIPRPAKPQRALPTNASTMHPCMLLTQLRPDLLFYELKMENEQYIMGVDVDGIAYIGRAASKRNARVEAARVACAKHFGVKYGYGVAATSETADD